MTSHRRILNSWWLTNRLRFTLKLPWNCSGNALEMLWKCTGGQFEFEIDETQLIGSFGCFSFPFTFPCILFFFLPFFYLLSLKLSWDLSYGDGVTSTAPLISFRPAHPAWLLFRNWKRNASGGEWRHHGGGPQWKRCRNWVRGQRQLSTQFRFGF